MDNYYLSKISEIGNLIRNIRQSEGLSQVEFSEYAEIHPNSLSNFEKGKNVTLLTLIKCIDATGLSIEEFFQAIQDLNE